MIEKHSVQILIKDQIKDILPTRLKKDNKKILNEGFYGINFQLLHYSHKFIFQGKIIKAENAGNRNESHP